MEGLNQARSALDAKTAAGPWEGDPYAGMPDYMRAAGQNATGYAQGIGQVLRDTTALSGLGLQGAAAPWLNTAAGLASGGAGAADQGFRNPLMSVAQNGGQGMSSPMSEALRTAGLAGANSLASSVGTLGTVQQRALADPTQGTIDAAGLYANNPALDGAIKAAQSTVDQTLNQQTLPGIGRSASLTGNLNSSRAGMAEAMALRDAATLKGNIEGTMRGDAYAKGLTLAEQQRQAGLQGATAAATAGATVGNQAGLGVGNLEQNQGQFDTTARVQAATAGLGTDNTRDLGNAQVRLGAAGQLGSATNTGINAGAAAGNQAAGIYGLSSAVGGAEQTDAQNEINANRQMFDYQNGGWVDQALAPYWSIAGRPLGSESTTTQTSQQPSNILGTALGLGTLALTPFSGGYNFGNTFLGAGVNGLKGLFGSS